jgi:alpha-ketoglutarate-dependent taurine dioxygenase
MTYSAVDLRPLSDALGAEVAGVAMTEPPDERTYRELRAAWLQHQILLFHK